MKGLTDIDGILVGHATNLEARTGCTAILCPEGAVAGVDVRGTATGSAQLDVLAPLHSNERIHAVCLSGGSAYGLEAASGVMRYLESKGIGFKVGAAGVVPLVPAAIIFDLGIAQRGVRPGREMGEQAARAASNAPVEQGNVGAGTGATVGKILGLARAMKGGVGSATVWLDGPMAGVRVAALAVVNALGDVRDPESGHILAGARASDAGPLEFVDAAHQIKRGATGGFNFKEAPSNTTLVVVATNARLSKVQANRLAMQASIGVAKSISPVWTGSDGDVCFALSCGGAAVADPMALGIAAAEATQQAIVNAVLRAAALGGVPGLG
ncbi:MAG: P1 family peptidase [Bryobacterales bacterium]|nr:P1 family peptidase [Bryobacterales bacterium]